MKLVKMIQNMALLLLLIAGSSNAVSQITDSAVKGCVTLKNPDELKKKKSKIIFIDSSKVIEDFISDSLFNSFHKGAETVYSYSSSFSIKISGKNRYCKQGRCANVFDTIANHLVSKYFLKYKWKFPEMKDQKKGLISLYLSYAADDKYFLIEVEEFYRSNFLSIYRKKIPFADFPK
jgi:hypothetical protein